MARGARDHRLVDLGQVDLRPQAALEPEDARPDLCRRGEISLARTVSADPAQPHGCAERRRAGPDTVRGREPHRACPTVPVEPARRKRLNARATSTSPCRARTAAARAISASPLWRTSLTPVTTN